ncbi:hypothetical protein GQR58_007128 [Nymphon striatum]|nr:hypothetical protein GQR58_007128 [Nymphon striatum]
MRYAMTFGRNWKEVRYDEFYDTFYKYDNGKWVFHYCFGGYKYDFLCPNFTLYDQTTFTCRYVNMVKCTESEDHYNRNVGLFEKTKTTTPTPIETAETESEEKKDKKLRKKHKKHNKQRHETETTEETYEETESDYGDTESDYYSRESEEEEEKNK